MHRKRRERKRSSIRADTNEAILRSGGAMVAKRARKGWGKFHPGEPPQVEAFDKVAKQKVRMHQGEADKYRDWARKERRLLCPTLRADGRVCEIPFAAAVSGGGKKRDHFRHPKREPGQIGHAEQSVESQWHTLAKQAIETWAYATFGATCRISVEERHEATAREPDVMVERDGHPTIAFEVCFSSPGTGTDWLERHRAYQEKGVIDVWLLSDVSGKYGLVKCEPVPGKRWKQVKVTLPAIGVEMLRHGVVPLWLHVAPEVEGEPLSREDEPRVGTLTLWGKSPETGRSLPISPKANAVREGWNYTLLDDLLSHCGFNEQGFMTPGRRRQLANDSVAVESERSPIARPGPTQSSAVPSATRVASVGGSQDARAQAAVPAQIVERAEGSASRSDARPTAGNAVKAAAQERVSELPAAPAALDDPEPRRERTSVWSRIAGSSTLSNLAKLLGRR